MCNRKQEITAVIYDKRGRVISIGYNSYVKTHPMQAFYAKKTGNESRVFLHAEMDAIIKAGSRIQQAYKISIFRYTRDGKPACAKPCAVCQEALKHTPIKIVEHT